MLDLVGIGSSVSEARDRAYEAVAVVRWPGMQHPPISPLSRSGGGT